MKAADRFRDWLLRPITRRLDRLVELEKRAQRGVSVVPAPTHIVTEAARHTMLSLRSS